MSQKTIGEIYAENPADPLDGTELFGLEQSGASAGTTGAQIAQMVMPAGMFGEFGNVTAPDGWLECDGAAVSRTTYAALFAAIGTVWGIGNGSTTFNVPDRRGSGSRGTGSHGSETMADGNPFAGPAVGAFEDDQLQGHFHVVQDTGGSNIQRTGGGSTGPTVPIANRDLAVAVQARATTEGAQGPVRDGNETRPFAAGVLICIKT